MMCHITRNKQKSALNWNCSKVIQWSVCHMYPMSELTSVPTSSLLSSTSVTTSVQETTTNGISSVQETCRNIWLFWTVCVEMMKMMKWWQDLQMKTQSGWLHCCSGLCLDLWLESSWSLSPSLAYLSAAANLGEAENLSLWRYSRRKVNDQNL